MDSYRKKLYELLRLNRRHSIVGESADSVNTKWRYSTCNYYSSTPLWLWPQSQFGPRWGIGLGLTDLWNGLSLTKSIMDSGFEMGSKGKKKHLGSQIPFWARAHEKNLFALTNIILGFDHSLPKIPRQGPSKLYLLWQIRAYISTWKDLLMTWEWLLVHIYITCGRDIYVQR